MAYDPLTAPLPSQPRPYPPTYWCATAGAPPSDDGPLQHAQETDIAIIGAGYTGLSCAYHLSKYYGCTVHVLEAHQPGWGCSGRNGSFMRPAIGRLSWADSVERFGPVLAKQHFTEAYQALATMRELIQQGDIDCDVQPDGWLKTAHQSSRIPSLQKEQQVMRDHFHYDTQLLHSAELQEYGLGGTEASAALLFPDAFSAHPLKIIFSLVQQARQAGAIVHSGSPVIAWDKEGATHCLTTPAGTLRAKHVVIATNGYSTERLHPCLKSRLMPVLSSIIVTRPLSDAEAQRSGFLTRNIITDTRKVLNFYRRLPDNRILLGSRGAIKESQHSQRKIQEHLLATLLKKFKGLEHLDVEYGWSGWVALSMDSMPRVHTVNTDRSISYAIGYNGSGTTASVYAGRILAHHLKGDGTISPLLNSPLPIFPFAPFRRLGQRAMFAYYKYQDTKSG